MIALKESSGTAPASRRPFTKKVGVEFTPIVSASARDAATAAFVSPFSRQSFTLSWSAPASFAIASSLSVASSSMPSAAW